jgi:hypothetical protein
MEGRIETLWLFMGMLRGWCVNGRDLEAIGKVVAVM